MRLILNLAQVRLISVNPFSSVGPDETWVILVKCVLGLLLGGLIGYEREVDRHPAGVRTHMLLILGAILFGETGRVYGTDRVAAQLVTGIGFLGAGAIFKLGTDIRGMTTAASIWATAAIGLAISAGGEMLIIAIIATFLVLFVLSMMERLEVKLKLKGQHRELLVRMQSRDALSHLLEMLDREGIDVVGIQIVSKSPLYEVALRMAHSKLNLAETVTNVDGVDSAEWV